MKFHQFWIVWLLASISSALCQDGSGTSDEAESSIPIQSEAPELRNFEETTSQKPTLTIREEQIEDELSNDATTTEKFMEKRKFVIKPTKENNEYREIFTVRFNDSGPTTIRSSSLSSTKRTKASFSSSFKKYDDPEHMTDDDDDVDFTTTFDGLTKKFPNDNGERKTRQRFEGIKGVTTNRGKTKYQNEPGTSEIPEILTVLRQKKPIRVKHVDENIKDDVVSTVVVDDLIDTTTIMDNSDIEQQRPKFKKPPLMSTHHPNFGTTTESSRRPTIRANLNLKQKITSSTIKTRLSEPDIIEPENVIIPSNKTLEVVASNIQSNKIRPFKVISQKGSVAQQPIPPTATAWALASLKAPNNTNRIFRKPINATNTLEQLSIVKPFITWSTRLQKTNEENSSTIFTLNNTNQQVTEFNEAPTELPMKYASVEPSTVNQSTPEVTSMNSLIHILSTSSINQTPNENDTIVTIVGGDTDQNKYEVYGSQKPDVENATTVIETLRPSSSTSPSESQNSNLLLVTSYKSIFENNNSSEVQQNVFTSSETPISESAQKKEDATTTTEESNIFDNRDEIQMIKNIEHLLPVVQTSTEILSKIPGHLNYSDDHNSVKYSTTTTGVQPSSLDMSLSQNIELINQNHSTTTERYIENVKTKLNNKISKDTDNRGSSDIVDFTPIMLSSEYPILSSTSETELLSTFSKKTTSELPLPTNELSNTSQAPIGSNSPGTFLPDFEFNSTDIHDDGGDEGQKNFESSSHTILNEPSSEADISENDVPMIITSLPTLIASTTTTSIKTTTTTTEIPTTTTTTTQSPVTTTITTQRPTTTTVIQRPTTTTTTTTPRPTTILTTTQRPTITTTLRPITTQSTFPSTPVVIETIPFTTTTEMSMTSTTLPPTTTIGKQNSTTLRPKPAVVDSSSTILGPNVKNVEPHLTAMINSSMEDICESKDEFMDAIIKLFESGTKSVFTKNQIKFINVDDKECSRFNDNGIPTMVEFYLINSNGNFDMKINKEFISLLQDNHKFDYKSNVFRFEFLNYSKTENIDQNPRLKAAMYLSCVAGICTIVVLILLVVRKRQKRFNYGQRCTPVSLDDYSMDNISVYNSVRRKGALRASKRSYGNPAFDDSTAVTHSLNFAGLASFSEDRPAIDEEFSNVPVITVKPDELPSGVETKNRYANVIPLPETRVMLNPRGASQNSDYINANFVKGYKGADKFYIACQAPMQSTLPEFWQMIWEQNTRVIMMLTSLTEKGVEKCADYLPPSEVLDCHRLFGDYQITLKKREVKDKYIISSLQIKNLETNLWRDVTHLWYGGWPAQGVPSDSDAMLAYLIEARSHMKTNSGPHVVHCSPGTGRTGTVIACDIAIREFELSRNVDVPKTVYAIRRCRAGAVQTRDQYALIYKVVNLYASKLSGGVLDSI